MTPQTQYELNQGEKVFGPGSLLLDDVEVQNPENPDANLPRYGYSPILDIDIRNRDGSRKVGNFKGGFLRRRTLLPFLGLTAESMREIRAEAMTGVSEAISEPFNPDIAMAAAAPMRIWRSPLTCSNDLLRDYGHSGFTVFEELKHWSYEEVRRFFQILLPAEAITVTRKILFGIGFEGPFLFEMRPYLLSEGMQNIYNAQLKAKAHGACEYLLRGLFSAHDKGWAFANKELDDSERDIREKQKRGYDQVDWRFTENLPPLDLLLLAETNRTPQQFEQLEAASQMSKEIGREIASEFATRNVQSNPPGITKEDLEGVLARQNEKFKTQFDEVKMFNENLINENKLLHEKIAEMEAGNATQPIESEKTTQSKKVK